MLKKVEKKLLNIDKKNEKTFQNMFSQNNNLKKPHTYKAK